MPMSDRRPTSLVLPIAVTLAVLLGVYVGAYYAMVEPLRVRGGAVWPTYRGEFQGPWSSFFGLAHVLDCRLRPHVWER